MRPQRFIVAALLLAALVGSAGASRAATLTPLVRTGSFRTVIRAQAVDALIPSCDVHVHWSFSGFKRTNGTVYGTFSYYSEDTCTNKMVWLTTQSNMHKQPNPAYPSSGTSVCGVDHPAATGTCTHVRKDGSTYCDPCNGAWSMDGYWELRFPTVLGYLYAPLNPQVVCTKTLNGKLKCTGHDLAPGTI